MPKIKYRDIKFKPASLKVIEQANAIIREYQAMGFDLTLRQLYYQFVSRALIPNKDTEYKNLGGIINDARLAGLIDWEAIVDRTRFLRAKPFWAGPENILQACASQFNIDMWASQKYRPEVWIEKDALVGVIEGVCNELDVPFFSCRGYTSQSEMWQAAQRVLAYDRRGQRACIFHLGDHDPSGIDMSRDIADRIELFTGSRLKFARLALNMDQVEQYNPPPNPAKLSDARAHSYVQLHGDESWELDALEPQVIAELIRNAVGSIRDRGAWNEDLRERDRGRRELALAAKHWDRLQGDDGYLDRFENPDAYNDE